MHLHSRTILPSPIPVRNSIIMPSSFLIPCSLLLIFLCSHLAHATNWAVLIAGSKGYINYRHQANICHAYQILKKGGLRDENIIVFMYDDIANDVENPHKGVIINKPKGPDVYKGVPKDYTGDSVTADNLIAVILGNKKAIKGGSGKVLNSGPNDRVFIYHSGHGGPGHLAMPVGGPLYANDVVDALKNKHASKSYRQMVVYVESCYAGSIFDGLLPGDINIYTTTSSKPDEKSYATYCPPKQGSPKEYSTCLGDHYSVAWMEDSDEKDAKKETLEEQYQVVKKRTSPKSTVMQYGDAKLSSDVTGLYFGDSSGRKQYNNSLGIEVEELISVDEDEADIVYLRQKVKRAPKGSKERAKAQRMLDDTLAQRKRVDQSVEEVGHLLFGWKNGRNILNTVRPAGRPLVDDWDCLKSTVESFEAQCGSVDFSGMKYPQAFANICNAGIRPDVTANAFAHACKKA